MQVVQLVVTGLCQGGLYALLAVGMMTILRTTGVVNFGHAAFVAIGGYSAHLAGDVPGSPLIVAILFAVIGGILGGLLFYLLIEAIGAGHDELKKVLGSLGVGAIITGVITSRWGSNPVSIPRWRSNEVMRFGEVVVNTQLFVLFVSAVVMLALLAIFFARSIWGFAMLAAHQSRVGAASVGIPIKRVEVLAWMVGGVTAAVAGAIYAPLEVVTPGFGSPLLVKAFAALVLAGLASVWGAMMGSFLLGIVESLTGYYASAYQVAVSFLVVAIVVLVAPGGLFRRPERVLNRVRTLRKAAT